MARVLIVDDSRFMVKALRMYFEQLGHEVVADANDGVEAIKAYRKHLPDVVTLDMNMPRLNGRETVSKIIEHFPDANIIMISSERDQETIITCVAEGASQYIIKPITIEKLEKAMEHVLDKFG